MKKRWIALMILSPPIILVILCISLIHFGTQYTPRYTFDDRTWKKVSIDSNTNANWVRFESVSIKEEFKKKYAKAKMSDLDDLIGLSITITKKRLRYDTATLLNRDNTDMAKVNRQHDVDWLFEHGHANCIGYAYLFAAVFNELKFLHPQVESADVRVVYESPAHVLFGLVAMPHTWNEVVFLEGGEKKSRYIDANAADYFFPGNVTRFVKEHNTTPR